MEHMNQLLEIMKSLRNPDSGCPWDIEQKFSTIAPYTIEEAYEVADAIARDNMDELCSELGDLLFQVVYHSQMADEQGFFNFKDVTENINEKLIRRHPHVFGESEITDAKSQTIAWEAIKTEERLAKQGKVGEEQGLQQEKLLDGINQAMPSLSRAQKLQDRAATVGFDWNDSQAVLDKIKEELEEVEEEINAEEKNAEKIVLIIIPPTITPANPRYNSAPAPGTSNNGNIPNILVSVLMRIGRNRIFTACSTAFLLDNPSRSLERA